MKSTVLIINDFGYVDGGASQVAINSAIELSKYGNKVIFFTAVGPITPELYRNNIKIISTNQCEILKYPNKLKGAINGIWNRTAAAKLKEVLCELNPKTTIIHVHVWIKALSAAIFQVIHKMGFKMVVTAHEYFLSCPNGGFYNYRKNKICSYEPLTLQCYCENCDKRNYVQKMYRVIRAAIQKKILQRCNVNIIFISQFSEKILEESINFKYRKFFLRNIISPIKRMPNVKKIADKYIYIGRLSPEKGVDLFCDAIVELGLKGIVIGDGELRQALMAKYKEYDNLIFTSWLSHEQISDYLTDVKALIIPSRWYETAVLTIPEIQFNNDIPVIVGHMCAGSEFVQDGKNGMIFESGNFDSLVNCIKKCEKNGFEYLRCVDEYSMNNDCYTKNLLTIYNDILSNK